jgi:hypothetical protein
MADALATPGDLNLFTGRDIPYEQASMMLSQASAVIRNHCAWHIAPSQTDTLTLNGSNEPRLFLPTLHVTAVASVHELEELLVADDDYTWSETGYLYRVGSFWPADLRSVVATFTHGWEFVPEDLASVCLEVATRAMASPAGIRQESAGGVSVTYAIPGGLTEYEKAVLEAYRLGPRV